MKNRGTSVTAAVLSILLLATFLVAFAPGRADAVTRMRKFKQNGTLVASKDWTLYTPTGLATGNQGHVFVACSDNRIRKFTNTGAYLNSIVLTGVRDVDVDAAGNIWAISSTGMYEFSSDGHVMRHWNASGDALAVDRQGYVWFSDAFFMYRCRTDGHLLATLQQRSMHLPGFEWESVVSLTSTANDVWRAYVGSNSPRILGYDRTAPVESDPSWQWNTPTFPTSLASDSLGYLYVTAADNRAYKYRQTGTPVTNFPTGIQTAFDIGTTTRYAGIDIDPWGYIWVVGR